MDYWQEFSGAAPPPPYRDRYPAVLPDGAVLDLPIRDFGEFGVAGFIANQASFPVVGHLGRLMTEVARPFGATVVVGLPSLGQVFAPLVAEALGHTNWIAPGWSRKRWYEEALSVPVNSITSPTERRLWLDPRLLPRLAGQRVLLVDDVISTGASAQAGLALLHAAGCVPVAMVVAMAQGDRWRAAWPGDIPLRAAFSTPILAPSPLGWLPAPLPKDHAA